MFEIHIAHSLKRLLIILLFISFGGHATGLFSMLSDKYESAQVQQDKADDTKDEKHGNKDFILSTDNQHFCLVTVTLYPQAGADAVASPVLDHHTPPPDFSS